MAILFKNYFENYSSESVDYAGEGFFGPVPVEKLLKNAKKNSVKHLKTVDDCDKYLEQLENESDKFENLLGEIKNAGEEYNTGKIEKSEMKSRVNAAAAQIKAECKLLKLNDFVKKNEKITEDEINNVSAFIKGLYDVVKSRKDELNNGGNGPNGVVAESYTDIAGNYYVLNEYGDYEMSSATEGLFDRFTKRGKDAKTEVDAMDTKTLEKVYAEAMKGKYKGDIKAVSDEEYGEGYTVRKIMNVPFGVSESGEYKFAVSRGKGKGIKFIIANIDKMKKTVTSELIAYKKAEERTKDAEKAVESLSELMYEISVKNDTGRYYSVDDAREALESLIGISGERSNYNDDSDEELNVDFDLFDN